MEGKRTISQLFTKMAAKEAEEGVDTSDEKRLKRWDSLRVVAKSVSNLTEIGNRVVETVRTKSKQTSSIKGSKSRSLMKRGGNVNGAGTGTAATIKQRDGGAATAGAAAAAQMFGVDLETLMERQRTSGGGESARMCVPLLVNKLVEHLLCRGVRLEGILRIAGSHGETDQLKQRLNGGQAVDLYAVSPHVLGDLLKSFIRELPGSLFDARKWDRWMALADLEDPVERAKQIKALLLDLPIANRALITVLFFFLRELTRNQKYSRMDVSNVARVFAPSVLQEPVYNALNMMTAIPKLTAVVETMLHQYDLVFRELQAQYTMIRTINASSAMAARGSTAKMRSTLRSVPAPPPPAPVAPAADTAVPSMAEEATAASSSSLPPGRSPGKHARSASQPENTAAAAAAFKKMRSEEVLTQRFRLPLSRAQTVADLADAENPPAQQQPQPKNKRMRPSDAENVDMAAVKSKK